MTPSATVSPARLCGALFLRIQASAVCRTSSRLLRTIWRYGEWHLALRTHSMSASQSTFTSQSPVAARLRIMSGYNLANDRWASVVVVNRCERLVVKLKSELHNQTRPQGEQTGGSDPWGAPLLTDLVAGRPDGVCAAAACGAEDGGRGARAGTSWLCWLTWRKDPGRGRPVRRLPGNGRGLYPLP